MSVKEFVTVDFSGGTLKALHMRILPTKKEIVNAATADINGLDEEGIAKAVKEALSKFKVKAPHIIHSIPSNLIITKNIEIPSTNPKEIHEILNLQASRYTPYSREEIIVDYIDIATVKNNYTKILLVIVARSAMKRQFEILEKVRLPFERVVLAPEALARWAVKAAKLNAEQAPASLVHIDEVSSDFLIIAKNKPTYIRSIPIGTQHFKEAGDVAPRFIEEVKKSFEAYQNEDIDKSPHVLILSGALGELKELEEAFNSTMHLNTVSLDYLKGLSVSPEAQGVLSGAKNLSFMGLASSVLVSDETKVNLIPEEVKLKKALEERARELIKTGIFVLACFVLVFSTLISKIYFKNNYLEMLNARYGKVYGEAERLEKQFSRVTMIRDYLVKRGYSLEVLSELHDASPLELELNDIRFDREGKFTVKGTAKSMSIVFSFVDNMEKSEYFKDVKTRYTTKRKDGDKDVTDFEVNCDLITEGVL
jgi:Tfp pilus assembly PilM family ATPase